MGRDKGLEELLDDDVAEVSGLSRKAMFGGWAWLVNGNLFCGVRDDGILGETRKRERCLGVGYSGSRADAIARPANARMGESRPGRIWR
jgi:hypothetical protein